MTCFDNVIFRMQIGIQGVYHSLSDTTEYVMHSLVTINPRTGMFHQMRAHPLANIAYNHAFLKNQAYQIKKFSPDKQDYLERPVEKGKL